MKIRQQRRGAVKTLCARVALGCALLAALPAQGAGHWLTVPDFNLEVSAGNALDFSELFGPVDLVNNNPANKRVRVLSGKGSMTLDGVRPNRFMCAAMNFAGPWERFPDTEGAQKIATQLRRHGYNLVRVHHVEGALMEGVEASPDNDLKFHPDQKAAFYNFLRVLKANGIHFTLDMVMDDNAAWGMVGKDRAENTEFRTKLWVHYDSAARNHWNAIVDTLYHQDYDGRGPAGSILRDPALASVNLVNELSLIYNIRKQPGNVMPDGLKDEMVIWARNRSPSVTITRADIPVVTDSKHEHSGLMIEFLNWKERQTAISMKGYVEARSGADLLVSAYNNGKVIQTVAARDSTDMVSMHVYHDADGRPLRSDNNSSFEDALYYYQVFASNRVANKPFLVDEYDIPYWNKWRREAGISIPAYASLQEWDGLCRYSNPIAMKYEATQGVWRSRRIYPYSIGMDPVARAGETLAALLFRRGDVAPANNTFTMNLTDNYLNYKSAGNQFFPSAIGRAALISKIAVQRAGPKAPKPTAFSFNVSTSYIKESQAELWAENLQKILAADPDNPSYVLDDVQRYVSDTGQLTLNVDRSNRKDPVYYMSVRTPRTEAHTFQAGKLPNFRALDQLTVESTDTDALVALSSIDKLRPNGTGPTLTESKRLLLIVATDALNSGSVFEDENRSEVIELGDLPVQIESVNMQLSMRLDPAKNYKVYPLHLNGDRRALATGGYETIATQPLADDTGFGLRINLADLIAPTTFFEIERQD
jgi:hypothetical protein